MRIVALLAALLLLASMTTSTAVADVPNLVCAVPPLCI